MLNQRKLPQRDKDRALEDVLQEFGRCLQPNGPYGGFDECCLREESFRRLVLWAKEVGVFYQDLIPDRNGGREHDVTHDCLTKTWLKFTKPSSAGFTVDFDDEYPYIINALPQQYFARLLLHNEIFGDNISFVGVSGPEYKPRIITRQLDASGEPTNHNDILTLMTLLGFDRLNLDKPVGYLNSMAFMSGNVAVFDLHGANVIKTSDDLLIVIDCIPVILNNESIEYLKLFI